MKQDETTASGRRIHRTSRFQCHSFFPDMFPHSFIPGNVLGQCWVEGYSKNLACFPCSSLPAASFAPTPQSFFNGQENFAGLTFSGRPKIGGWEVLWNSDGQFQRIFGGSQDPLTPSKIMLQMKTEVGNSWFTVQLFHFSLGWRSWGRFGG